MIDCEHYDNGLCKYATDLAEIPIYPTVHNCKNCKKHISAENIVVYSLCVTTLHKQGLFNKVKHLPLIEKTRQEFPQITYNSPGTCLRIILKEIGVVKSGKCQCDEYAAKMNKWGTVGCFEHRDDIIDHLNAQYVSWLDMVRVALAGYLTTGQLVDESLKRSMVLK